VSPSVSVSVMALGVWRNRCVGSMLLACEYSDHWRAAEGNFGAVHELVLNKVIVNRAPKDNDIILIS